MIVLFVICGVAVVIVLFEFCRLLKSLWVEKHEGGDDW